MMGAPHFGGGISSASFGFDCFVRNLSFRAQSFIPFRLAFRGASAHIRSAEITRSIRIAAALQFGLVGHDSFRVPIDVCLALGS